MNRRMILAANGWAVVPDNRPGSGGGIGLDALAKSAPNGDTIALGRTANLRLV